MPRRVQWSLVAAWIGVGVSAGVALNDPFTRWVLLLVPTGLVAVWLLWSLDADREMGAGLIGFSVLPAVLGIRSRNPSCLAAGEFAACEPGPVWPWVITVLLLVILGSAIVAAPALRRKASSRNDQLEAAR